MTKCEVHKNYVGARTPKRSKNNPDGCPKCWEVYRERGEIAHKELTKKKPRKTRVAKPREKERNLGSGFIVEYDDLTGDYALMYQSRCLYVATDMEFVEAFVSGFQEGVRYART